MNGTWQSVSIDRGLTVSWCKLNEQPSWLSWALGGAPSGWSEQLACPHWLLWDLPPFLIRGFHTSQSLLFRNELEALRNMLFVFLTPFF